MRRGALWLLLLVLCQSCAFPGTGPSIEDVVDLQLRSMSSRRALTSPKVHITRRVPEGTLALFTYQADSGAGPERLSGVFVLQRAGLGWSPMVGGSIAPIPFDETASAVQFGIEIMGMGEGANQYSVAYGVVSDAAVSEIVATFSDGSQERTAVENGAYLIVRLPAAEITRVEALDATGQVLHRQDGR